jgi:hypothetical protein
MDSNGRIEKWVGQALFYFDKKSGGSKYINQIKIIYPNCFDPLIKIYYQLCIEVIYLYSAHAYHPHALGIDMLWKNLSRQYATPLPLLVVYVY